MKDPGAEWALRGWADEPGKPISVSLPLLRTPPLFASLSSLSAGAYCSGESDHHHASRTTQGGLACARQPRASLSAAPSHLAMPTRSAPRSPSTECLLLQTTTLLRRIWHSRKGLLDIQLLPHLTPPHCPDPAPVPIWTIRFVQSGSPI
ncbi:hypothetical protein JZ751_008803 [Albula glossodonta]|uniref:Uncharacterized protein n=1 Tax=Albula glossodonta TaxID=121402 RepID=A0A8T2NZZ6_9TELE|nr:hypothetical protein JZ751_008803 [Albula glossodonta]